MGIVFSLPGELRIQIHLQVRVFFGELPIAKDEQVIKSNCVAPVIPDLPVVSVVCLLCL